MATVDKPTAQDDAAEVRRLFADGKRLTDPELLRRIRGRSVAARQAIFERNGVLDVAVPSIRELRDE